MFTTVNIRNVDRSDPTVLYCGRRNVAWGLPESPLHNPYKGDQTEAIKRFREYFEQERVADGPLRRELVHAWRLHQQHGEVKLACWCKPLACHTDVIAEFLNAVLGKNR